MKIEKQLAAVGEEFNVIVRRTTDDDNRIWAKGSMLKRCPSGTELMFELNHDNKVYILERKRITSLHLEGVCEQPSEELLDFIEKWKQQ